MRREDASDDGNEAQPGCASARQSLIAPTGKGYDEECSPRSPRGTTLTLDFGITDKGQGSDKARKGGSITEKTSDEAAPAPGSNHSSQKKSEAKSKKKNKFASPRMQKMRAKREEQEELPAEDPEEEIDVMANIGALFGSARSSKLQGGEALEGWQLFNLARESQIPLDEVRSIKNIFDEFDDNKSGTLEYSEFTEVMKRVLNIKPNETVPQAQLDAGWKAADEDGSGILDFREFLTWFSSHGFAQDMLLTDEQRWIRTIAKKFEVPIDDIEAVKRVFDKYDEDGSGHLELEEFSLMLEKLLKVPPELELPKGRVKSYFAEIDLDGSGEVDFEEFLDWYVKYFDINGGCTNASPIEAFYGNTRRMGAAHMDKRLTEVQADAGRRKTHMGRNEESD